MSVTNIDLNDFSVANRYLAGQLDDAECAAFEAQLVRNPQSLQLLEATARLKVGLEKLRETGELAHALTPRPWHGRSLLMALAASVVALVIGLFLSRSSVELAGPTLLAANRSAFVDLQGEVLPLATTLAVFRKRVEAYDAVIELPSSPQSVALRVMPETPAESGRYRVSLLHLGDAAAPEAVASVAGLRPDGEGFVTVFANAWRLIPGRYRLVVSHDGVDDSPTGGDAFLIRVMPAPTN